MTTLYDQIQKEYARIEQEVIELKGLISTLPQGDLDCNKNGSYYKWFLNQNSGNRNYLSKSDHALVKELALKKYYSLQLKDDLLELDALNCYLNSHKKPSFDSIPNKEAYQLLLSSHLISDSDELQKWSSASFHKNSNYPNQLIHKSISGNILRSKSEAMIDLALFTHQIPFRYECELELDGSILYPDFTIHHPKRRQVFFWEHFGLMDQPSYIQNTYSKLNFYTTHGIIPSIQLITTFETKDAPLTIDTIEWIIHHYFL